MSDLKNTLKELKEVIKELKTQADKGTAWNNQDKENIEKRLEHLNDKSKPHHSNLTEGLKLDTQDLDNLEALIGADKTQWATEKSKLEKDKKDAETAKSQAEKDKSDEIEKHNKTKQEIADKLSTDLITGLDNIIKTGGIKYKKPKKKADGTDETDSNGNIIYEDATLDFDDKKLAAIKTVVEELKTKTDLSSLDNKFKEIKEATEKGTAGDKGTNVWSITACVLGGLSFLFTLYLVLTRKEVSKKDKAKDEEE